MMQGGLTAASGYLIKSGVVGNGSSSSNEEEEEEEEEEEMKKTKKMEQEEEKTWCMGVTGVLEHTDPLKEAECWKKQSIFKLPSFVKERNVKAYEPQVVSIGPYHHGKHHLKPMEVHKQRAVRHFIKRSGVPIQTYKSALVKVVQLLKESYVQLDEAWLDENKFVQLMILDGCFILEFLAVSSIPANDYAHSDPIFSYHGHIVNYNSVMQDLLLVENQLPYLVFSTLFSIGRRFGEEENIHGILSWMMFAPNKGPGLHMLDMYMKGLLEGGPHFEEERVVKRSALELYQAGIQFKKVGSYKNIEFDKSTGILNLPAIIVNDYTISTLLNLIAFELRVGTGRELNSYIRLIDTLIDSGKDVRLLQSQGIIVSSLGSDEAVVKLLKELTKDTVVDVSSKSNVVLKQMNDYYEQSMNKWRRRFRDWRSNLYQNYFSNPWTSISVGAAAFLLAFTVIQTIYTVLSFYSAKKQQQTHSI